METSENNERLIVFAESIIAAIAALLVGYGYEVWAALLGGIAAAVFVFWSQWVNTSNEKKRAVVKSVDS
jgi:hypothetical protein